MPSISTTKNLFRTLCFGALIFAAPAAFAQEPTVSDLGNGDVIDIIPYHPAETGADDGPSVSYQTDTHPPLKLTPDKSELIKLDKKAGSIIVGNPNHLNVMADSATTLVLSPQLPGATYLTVLDTEGKVIMQRHVIVASPKEQYVRVRRSCAGGGKDCQETQVYFCPDMCHEIGIAQEAKSAENAPVTDQEATSIPTKVEDVKDQNPSE